jgi:hypothetical protein
VVEEFTREREVAGSKPGRRKVCKNRKKNAATIEWVCVAASGDLLGLKKICYFLLLFCDF